MHLIKLKIKLIRKKLDFLGAAINLLRKDVFSRYCMCFVRILNFSYITNVRWWKKKLQAQVTLIISASLKIHIRNYENPKSFDIKI